MTVHDVDDDDPCTTDTLERIAARRLTVTKELFERFRTGAREEMRDLIGILRRLDRRREIAGRAWDDGGSG